MRVLFFGTSEFALPPLEALLARHPVVGVVTQPDRPAGRGRRPSAPPVKRLAELHGLPCLQPLRLRDPGWVERLTALDPEIGVVAAYGQILPPAILAVPPRGCVNLHASLLPRYRGAAPIQWAIIRGERETGLTTFVMDEGMDTGPILLQERVAIGPEETAGELARRLAVRGATLLLETLDGLAADRLAPVPQPPGPAVMAPRLSKEDGWIDWGRSAEEIVSLIRGANPWPGAATAVPSGRLLLWRARAFPGEGEPGSLLPGPEGGLVIAAGQGVVRPVEVQPENRRAMSWEEFLRGARLAPGVRFGSAVPAR